MVNSHIDKLSISKELDQAWKNAVVEAAYSKHWSIEKDYNGCTAVQDYLHPSPACTIHDYCWITGMGGRKADNIFYHLMLAEGMKKAKAKRRWFAVRVAWFAYFQWKYIIIRTWRKPTPKIQELYNLFNQIK